MFEEQDNKRQLWKKFLEEGLPFGLFVGIALVGVTIWFASLTFREYQKISRIKNWQKVECEITASSVNKEAGKKNSDLFVVRYKYAWQGKEYEGQRCRYDYDGDTMYYPGAQELSAKYAPGKQTYCFVNPRSPEQAVLEQEKQNMIWPCILLAFMGAAGIRYIRKSCKDFFALPPAVEQSAYPSYDQTQSAEPASATDIFWKWSLRIGFIIAVLAVGWFVIFVTIFFVIVPYLFVSAGVRKGCEEFSKQLAQTPIQDTTNSYTSTEKHKVFSTSEKFIIVIGVCFFLIIEGLWLRSMFSGSGKEDRELFALFGVIFSLFVTLAVSSWLIFAAIMVLRERRNKKSQSKLQPAIAEQKMPLLVLLKFAFGCILILGAFGFLMGAICGLLVIPGPPGITASVKFPLAEPQGIAISPDGRIVCQSSFYRRIQIYDSNGKLEKGWFGPSSGKGTGMQHLTIDESGRIRLARSRNEYFYDFNGKLLEEKKKKYDFDAFVSEFGAFEDISAQDAQGNKYVFEHPSLCPYLVKITPDGSRQTIINEPGYLWFLYGPFPAWLTAVCSGGAIGLLCFIEKRIKKI